MDASKLLEILDYLDVEDHNKPISIDDLYVKVFGSLPDHCSKVGGYLPNLKCIIFVRGTGIPEQEGPSGNGGVQSSPG